MLYEKLKRAIDALDTSAIVSCVASENVDETSTVFGGFTPLQYVLRTYNSHPKGLEIFQALLSKCRNLEIKSRDRLTALQHAVFTNVAFVEALIDAGADCTIQDENRMNLLHFAASQGETEMVSLFLRQGVGINSFDALYRTPAYMTVVYDHPDCLRFLMDHHADLNTGEYTSLQGACISGSLECLRLLIRNGEDIAKLTFDGRAPIQLAQVNGHNEIVSVLEDTRRIYSDMTRAMNAGDVLKVAMYFETGINVDRMYDEFFEGATLLQYSIFQECDLGIVDMCISQSKDLDITDVTGWTSLHYACDVGRLDIVKLLVDKGANIHAANVSRTTPLHLACVSTDVDMVKFLLDNGADPNVKNDDGWTPAHKAIENGSHECLRSLVDKGIDVNANAGDETPLHLACRWGEEDCVRILLENGASVLSINSEGETVLSLATKCDNDIIRALISQHANLENSVV